MHKVNVRAAHDQNTGEELYNAIALSLTHISRTTTLMCTSNLTMEYQTLSSELLDASQSTLGHLKRRYQDWFYDDAIDIRSLIHDKMLHQMLYFGIQLLELFMNDFPPFVLLVIARCNVWRTTGGCRRLSSYRVILVSLSQIIFVKH